jgi:type 1 glutamine amidotransferase
MKRTACRSAALLATVGAMLVAARESAAKPIPSAPIEAAIPAEATVKPKQPRRLLVFNTRQGHAGAAQAAAKALDLMGQKTGAWTTTVSDDPAVFEPDSLKAFDAVCINNTSGFNPFGATPARDAPKEEKDAAAQAAKRREEAFLAYLRGGGGVVGFHSATDSRSAILVEVFSGKFSGHPWVGNETVTVRIDDPNHALTRCFAGQAFEIQDEIYQFTDPSHADFRKKLRVLLTLDMMRTARKGSRADHDYAVAWIKPFGQGRVFYSSLGHNPHVFWDPRILRFYQDGIQFALGDLEADARPSAEVGIQAPPLPPAPAKP